jgi:hypothetical protein
MTKPCGEDRPVRTAVAELCSAAQTGTSGPTWFVVRAWSVLRSVVLEIFDESAYARFLARNAIPSSRDAYAAFLHEQQALRARRPRCC